MAGTEPQSQTQPRTLSPQALKDYRSMTYLLAVAETHPDRDFVRDSIKKARELSTKLEEELNLDPTNPNAVLVYDEIAIVNRVYAEKIGSD